MPADPDGLWKWLATTLARSEDAKTVVMAMKLVDLLELVRTGHYLEFGAAILLPVDLRIARISVTSGLVAASSGGPIQHLMSRAGTSPPSIGNC